MTTKRCLCVTKIYHLSEILASNYVGCCQSYSKVLQVLVQRVSDSFGHNLVSSASFRYISGDKVHLEINIISVKTFNKSLVLYII